MKQGLRKLLNCRRSIIALTGILACVIITYLTSTDTSGSIALIVTSVAGANAAQAVFRGKQENSNEAS